MFSFLTFLNERVSTDQENITVNAYHGSGTKFNKFEQSKARIHNDYMGGGEGYFTSSHDVAKRYAKHMAKHSKTNTPFIYHTTIKMKKVFDVDHDFSGSKLHGVLPDEKSHEDFARGAGLLKAGSDKHDILSKLKSGDVKLKGDNVFRGLDRALNGSANARKHLIKKGYDGLRYNGGDANTEKHSVYLPYKSDNIKINKVTKIVKKSSEEV